jgi:hypothetical protein
MHFMPPLLLLMHVLTKSLLLQAFWLERGLLPYQAERLANDQVWHFPGCLSILCIHTVYPLPAT